MFIALLLSSTHFHVLYVLLLFVSFFLFTFYSQSNHSARFSVGPGLVISICERNISSQLAFRMQGMEKNYTKLKQLIDLFKSIIFGFIAAIPFNYRIKYFQFSASNFTLVYILISLWPAECSGKNMFRLIKIPPETRFSRE
jgi:hypothetical protein